MNTSPKKSIALIGSGLAGSFLAVLLAKRGYKVDIYERLAKKEIYDTASKRSYNIVLFGYGIDMLQKAGMWNILKPHLLALKGSVTHINKNAQPITTLLDPKKTPYFTIARAKLAALLLEEAGKQKSVSIHYQTTLVTINRHEKTMVIHNTKTNTMKKASYDVLIGADGANSLVRFFMQQGQETNHSQEYATWRYRQFMLSPQTVEQLGLEKSFVHTWTHKNAFITMHPDSKQALSAMLVFPKTMQNFTSEHTVKLFFEEHFPKLLPALPEIAASILANPDGNFATIHTDPWYYKDNITIIGDAAHGFYPFFGQGASAAFGDCMTLCTLLDRYQQDWSKTLPAYQEARKQHTDALGELSKEVIQKYLRYKKADYDAVYDKLESVLFHFLPTVVKPSLSQLILSDPAHAADHRALDRKRKTIAKWMGVSFLVLSLTGLAAMYEGMAKRK